MRISRTRSASFVPPKTDRAHRGSAAAGSPWTTVAGFGSSAAYVMQNVTSPARIPPTNQSPSDPRRGDVESLVVRISGWAGRGLARKFGIGIAEGMRARTGAGRVMPRSSR